MVEIVFPTSTAPGARPGEGSGRLINCYAEKLDTGARATFARRRTPGLRRLVTGDHVGCRGLHYQNGVLYVAQAERLSKVTFDGTDYAIDDLGELPGTKRVTFAHNNKAPIPDILVTTEDDTFEVTSSGAPTSLSDADLPQALSVDFLDGYFVFAIRDGRFFVSGINDVTVNALDFAKAESRPGGLYRAIGFAEQLVLLGPNVLEFWQNTGNATGSPFSRASTFPLGLASPFAVAGNEFGFPSLVFVASDNGVYRLDGGYSPRKISPPDLDRLIAAVVDKETIDVTVSVTPGHIWATVTGPAFSWTCDLTTGFWHERKSYGMANWRGLCAVEAFGGWVVGDRVTGDVWLLDDTYQREGDEPLVISLLSLPAGAFPNRVAIPRADFDVIVGQGLVTGQEPIETSPVCMISWSDDGGNTFSTPLERSLGALANHKTRVSVNRTGMAEPTGRVWKIDVSDPVYTSWLGGQMAGEALSR